AQRRRGLADDVGVGHPVAGNLPLVGGAGDAAVDVAQPGDVGADGDAHMDGLEAPQHAVCFGHYGGARQRGAAEVGGAAEVVGGGGRQLDVPAPTRRSSDLAQRRRGLADDVGVGHPVGGNLPLVGGAGDAAVDVAQPGDVGA